MKISRLTTLTPETQSLAREVSPAASGEFKNILKQKSSDEARAQAEKAAAGLVSQALILPILKQVRRSMADMKGPFSPGMAEKAFGPEFDMQLADRIAHSPRLGVTKALTERLLKRHGPDKALDVHG